MKCYLNECDKELTESNIWTVILDAVQQSYNGNYCSKEHACLDLIKTAIPNKNDFWAKLNSETPAAVGGNGGPAVTMPAQPAAQPAPADPELDLVLQAANGDGGVVNVAQDAAANEQQNQQQKLNEENVAIAAKVDKFINDIVNLSVNSNYPLGFNKMGNTYTHEGLTLPSTMYSVYSVNPSFTFTVVNGMDFVSFNFQNSNHNFTLKELDKIFESEEAPGKILSKINGYIGEHAIASGNAVVAPAVAPQISEDNGF